MMFLNSRPLIFLFCYGLLAVPFIQGGNLRDDSIEPKDISTIDKPPINPSEVANDEAVMATEATTKWTVSTFAGKACTASNTPLSIPYGISIGSDKYLYVADNGHHAIRKVAPDGTITLVAGSATGVKGSTDGKGTNAKFYSPYNLFASSWGTIYVADYGNSYIRTIDASGNVATVKTSSGSAINVGYVVGVVADSKKNIFTTDQNKNVIRKITPAGVLSVFAGSGSYGHADGTGAAATFSEPAGLAIDKNDNIFLADYDYGLVRKITPAGVVTTIGGSKTMYEPYGLTLDSAGKIYVVDIGENLVFSMTQAGVTSVFAGNNLLTGLVNGVATSSTFSSPAGVALDASGNIYVSDALNCVIRKITKS